MAQLGPHYWFMTNRFQAQEPDILAEGLVFFFSSYRQKPRLVKNTIRALAFTFFPIRHAQHSSENWTLHKQRRWKALFNKSIKKLTRTPNKTVQFLVGNLVNRATSDQKTVNQGHFLKYHNSNSKRDYQILNHNRE